MPYYDLREYLAVLERHEQLRRVKATVDWNLEVGAIIRRSYDLKAPAPLFENISGYTDHYRILGAPMGLSSLINAPYARLALALELPPDTHITQILETYIERKNQRINPIVVSDGPCKEEIHLGDDIDLLEFPVPMIHHGDGGRYIGTWDTVVTKDPDTGWVNWGMYRLMVHDRNTMGGIILPNHHNGLHYFTKYEKRGQPMEFAVALGTDPACSLASAAGPPPGVDEATLAGGFRGAPVELVKCETVDLEVPATAEIVIEGKIMPGERLEEGPFGEYTGFRAGDRAPRPVYRVTAVTHRRNPILPVSSVGVPVDDSAVIVPVIKAAETLDILRRQGLPVKMAYCPPAGIGHTMYVSTEVPYPGYPRRLAHAVWNSRSDACYQLVIVPTDVDVTNIDEVMWSMATRCHPVRGIYQVDNVPGNPLLPFLSREERNTQLAAYIMFDCTWPTQWPQDEIPEKASFDAMWPKEIQDRVLQRWQEYGL